MAALEVAAIVTAEVMDALENIIHNIARELSTYITNTCALQLLSSLCLKLIRLGQA
jgi:hypothetical protein